MQSTSDIPTQEKTATPFNEWITLFDPSESQTPITITQRDQIVLDQVNAKLENLPGINEYA